MSRRRKRSTFRRRGGKPYGQAERERAAFEFRAEQFCQQALEDTLQAALVRVANAMAQGLVDLAEAAERVSATLKTYSPRPVEVVVVGMSGAAHEGGIGLKLDRLPGAGPIILLPAPQGITRPGAE